MKKLILISALTLFWACSRQVNFEKLLPQAFSAPVELVTDISGNLRLSDYFPNLENVDSITCNHAHVIQSALEKDVFRIESDGSYPFLVLDIWKKEARTSLIVIDTTLRHSNNSLFITSAINNREQIKIQSNEPVDEWLVFWQNVEMPSSQLEISERSITVPVPENARWIDNSELRVMAFSKGILSNQTSVYLSHDRVSNDLSAIKSEYALESHRPKMNDEIKQRAHIDKVRMLQNSRLEWISGDEYALLDDDELLVYVRTYMGASSFFAFNKTNHDIKKLITVPDNVRMGNLKTYFDQSIKQTGENIVINLSAHSYEIATSEML